MPLLLSPPFLGDFELAGSCLSSVDLHTGRFYISFDILWGDAVNLLIHLASVSGLLVGKAEMDRPIRDVLPNIDVKTKICIEIYK